MSKERTFEVEVLVPCLCFDRHTFLVKANSLEEAREKLKKTDFNREGNEDIEYEEEIQYGQDDIYGEDVLEDSQELEELEENLKKLGIKRR